MTQTAAESQEIVLAQDGGVLTIRFNRPEAMNSLNLTTKEQLLAALRSAAEDATVRCVVLTGTGRAFCAGQDLREHASRPADEPKMDTVRLHYNPVVTLLATMNKPVIAALNGVAAGAGLSFCLAADLRIAASSAGLNTAFTAIGLSCDSGISFWLPRMVGVAKAKELLLMPRTIPAAEALELGLVTRVVDDVEFESTVNAVAAELAAGPTLAIGAVRNAIGYSAGHDLTDSLDHEGDLIAGTSVTEDHRDAVAAFLRKEKPVFNGR